MNIWSIIHRNINKNLARLLSAQAKAERRKEETFRCLVCGGEAYWGRASGNIRRLCGCKSCGMYLRGR